MHYDPLIFDLDGTLCDTADDIASSVAYAMNAEGLAAPTRQAVVSAIGAGARVLIERLVAEPARRERVLAHFLTHYNEHLLDRTRLYPGVTETLAALRGATLVIATNKPERPSRRIIEGLGIAPFFRAVYGGDTLPVRKPDAAVVRQILSDVGGTRPLLVGDSGTDVETARNAGIPCVAVTYGYSKPGELEGADWRIEEFRELFSIVTDVRNR